MNQNLDINNSQGQFLQNLIESVRDIDNGFVGSELWVNLSRWAAEMSSENNDKTAFYQSFINTVKSSNLAEPTENILIVIFFEGIFSHMPQDPALRFPFLAEQSRIILSLDVNRQVIAELCFNLKQAYLDSYEKEVDAFYLENEIPMVDDSNIIPIS